MLRSTLFGLILGCAATAFGQAVTFTGDVTADFAPSTLVTDPGGQDVGMPSALVAAGLTVSGWDIQHVALSYDGTTDTLFVGIDTFGIAGDADGDGDPGVASSVLTQVGGLDQPDLGGSEFFTFAFDMDADGALDVICGTPAGADINGFTCALYVGGGPSPFSTPWLRFGTPLPANTGPAPVSPSAGWPDLEFTVPNFSQLIAAFSQPGQTDIGVHVFLGSLEDGGIGEDYIPSGSSMLFSQPECLPLPNQLSTVSVVPGPFGNTVTLRYGLLELYGFCVLYSTAMAQVPVTIAELPNAPVVSVGAPGNLFMFDAGVAFQPRPAVSCYDFAVTVPFSIPSGTTIVVQTFTYPYVDVLTKPYYTSNVITYVQP